MDWLAQQAVRAQAKEQDLPSPCISVCRMDGVSGLCKGCLRTLEEIGVWSTLDDEGKRTVWARIEVRAAAQGVNR